MHYLRMYFIVILYKVISLSWSPSDDSCGSVCSFLHHITHVFLGHVVQLKRES